MGGLEAAGRVVIPLGLTGRDELSVLCLGAHADDIEIGCGGTVLRLVDEVGRLRCHWVVWSAPGARHAEAAASAEAFLAGATVADVEIHGFRESYLPWEAPAVKDAFESLKGRVDPDLVLTHSRDDLHQDHRLIAELTGNTFRDHLVLEYEIPKYDGDLGRPNVYVPLAEHLVRRKVELLREHFPSQHDRSWFDEETFLGLARLRGVEANSRYAEAFHGRKLLL